VITDYGISMILYFIGSLFVLTVFEPAEDSSPIGLLILAFIWPVYTIYLITMDLIYKREE
jgi:hypothetical protein